MSNTESLRRHRLRPLLGWSLSALWVVVVGWGFWQTEGLPLRQRFVAAGEAQSRIARLEQWFRASSGARSLVKATLIVDAKAACACDADAADTTVWTDLQAQGLQVVQGEDLPGIPLPQDAHAVLTLFSAQGKLLYAGPAALSDTCGQLSLSDLLWRGLLVDEPPFGTPIVQAHCDCPSIQV